jgi:hypothetical protein
LLKKTYLGNGVFFGSQRANCSQFWKSLQDVKGIVLEVLDISLEMAIKLDFGMISGWETVLLKLDSHIFLRCVTNKIGLQIEFAIKVIYCYLSEETWERGKNRSLLNY